MKAHMVAQWANKLSEQGYGLADCRRELDFLGKAPLVVILAVKMQGRAPLIGEKRL